MLNESKYGRIAIVIGSLLALTSILIFIPQLPLFVKALLLGLLLPLLFINLIIEFAIMQAFIQPNNRKESITEASWQELTTECNGVKARAMFKRTTGPAPLLLMIHGWKSNAESVRLRAEYFTERGWHALIVEMPGHGLAQPVKKWTATKVVEHCIELMEILPSKLELEDIETIVFYGHSFGGFVGLNLSRRISNYEWGTKFSGWIFESPMTEYSTILTELLEQSIIPSILHGSIKRRMMTIFSSLHPKDKPTKRLVELDVPIWGLPDQPMLVVQAEQDNRLGRGHYDSLLSAVEQCGKQQLLTAHLIGDLNHSGAQNNSNRDEFIDQWLEQLAL